MKRYWLPVFLLIGVAIISGWTSCSSGNDDSGTDADSDTDTDSDVDTDGDTDSDTDTDADTDTDSDADTDSDVDGGMDGGSDSDADADTDTEFVDEDGDGWIEGIDCDDTNPDANQDEDEIYDPPNGVDEDCDGLTDEEPENPTELHSYIWIANTGEGTVSKVDTRLEVEVARYITSPLGQVAEGDPSRTTINRHGDAVVLNRRHPVQYDTSSSSSVTKFAASIDDCIDSDADGIETSTSPTDVLAWGEDECMLWHTSLGAGIRAARAAAWDGEEDPETGLGGHVWIGTCEKLEHAGTQDYIYKLNGDTGDIMETIPFAGCAYGAAMDGEGGLWIVDRDAAYAVHRLDTETLNVDTYTTGAGYGIAIDNSGRIWATGNSGWNRVSMFDPGTSTADTLILDAEYSFPRGAGTGIEISAGYVWVADNNGYLLKFDESTFTLADAYPIGATGSPSTIGIGIDIDGYVWVVSMSENAAFKFDPISNTYVTVAVGTSPYTYSDMTGVQLLNQIPPT